MWPSGKKFGDPWARLIILTVVLLPDQIILFKQTQWHAEEVAGPRHPWLGGIERVKLQIFKW